MNTLRVTYTGSNRSISGKEFLHILVAGAMTLAILYLFTVAMFVMGT